MIRADGGVQAIQLPFRPPVAIGEGTIVKVAHGLYAEVQRAAMERRNRAWGLWLYVLPISTAQALLGWGEIVDVINLSDEAPDGEVVI